jgi:hypothetical protein
MADGADPAKKPGTDFDHKQQLARLQEQLTAVGEAQKLLENDKRILEHTISSEIVDRHRDAYLNSIISIHEKLQALIEPIANEEAIAGALLAAGLTPGTFRRVDVRIREALETLKQDARRHYGLTLPPETDRAEPPRAETPDGTHQETLAVVAAE